MKEKMTFGARIVRGLMWLLGQQPLKVHYIWAGGIAWLLRCPLHYRKKVVYTNLTKAFPEKSSEEINKIAKAYYQHMAEMIVEAIWFGGSTYKRLRKAHIVEMENPELLGELMAGGKALAIFDSHCGNWELLGGFKTYNYKENIDFPIHEGNLHVVYKKLTNKTFDDVFYANRKAPVKGYEGMVESAGLLRFFLSHKGQSYACLINNDQYPGKNGVEIGTFLGLETTAFEGSSAMAHKLGMAVAYMSMVNDRQGHYTIRFTKISEDASKDDPTEITKKYMSLLEADIRETPHNWLWSHKRWKNLRIY